MTADIFSVKKDKRTLARSLIPLGVISVSFAAIFIRWSNSHPIAVAFYRMFFSTLILLFFLPPHLSRIKKIDKRGWLTLITTGLLLAVHFAAWISSLSYTSVASSVVLVTAHPIVVAWISSWYLGEKTSFRAYIGIGIGLIGVFIMTFSNYRISGWAFLGDMLAIIGMLAFAGYLLRGRKIRQDMPVVPYAFIVYLFSTLFLGLFSIPFSTSFTSYPAEEYILFFALALIPTIFGHTLFNWGLKHLKARIISVSLLGEPIGASLLAFLILKEVPKTLTIVGGGITLLGIYICTKFE
ncbi:MAG: DMT family transporter [Candidatus Thermoplasmatota archaeon]|nr:DMT family transporter [Candidatus Thermoplasmatota archaeon]